MERDFLKNLDLGEGARLPDAAIEAIMKEHGKGVNPLRDSVTALTAERDGLKKKLEEAEDWKGRYAKDTSDLQGQLDSLKKEKATRDARDKVSAETGVPAGLLTGEDEESCKKQAEAMLSWRGKDPNYPQTGDPGGVHPSGGGGKTRDQFSEWFTSAIGKGE